MADVKIAPSAEHYQAERDEARRELDRVLGLLGDLWDALVWDRKPSATGPASPPAGEQRRVPMVARAGAGDRS